GGAASAANADTVTQSFGCGYDASTAPVGAVSAQFSLNGAAGGNGVNGGAGGTGANVTFTMPVSGGQSFGLHTGCTGGQAPRGGSGGSGAAGPGGGGAYYNHCNFGCSWVGGGGGGGGGAGYVGGGGGAGGGTANFTGAGGGGGGGGQSLVLTGAASATSISVLP